MKQPIEIHYNDDGTIQPVDAYLGDSIPPTSEVGRRAARGARAG